MTISTPCPAQFGSPHPADPRGRVQLWLEDAIHRRVRRRNDLHHQVHVLRTDRLLELEQCRRLRDDHIRDQQSPRVQLQTDRLDHVRLGRSGLPNQGSETPGHQLMRGRRRRRHDEAPVDDLVALPVIRQAGEIVRGPRSDMRERLGHVTSCFLGAGQHAPALRRIRLSHLPSAGFSSAVDNLGTLGPPVEEGFAGLVFAEGALVEAEVHEELVGLAYLATRRDAEDLHDLVAVEVGAEGIEFLLFP